MKMLMVICPDTRRADIRALIETHSVHAFTELKEVHGEGSTGKHHGTRIWPGKSSLFFTVVPNEKKDELIAALEACSVNLYPGEGLRAFVLPVEEAI